MQLRRLMIVLAICIVGLVVAALGMYRSWQNFTSGGLFGILSSHGHYMMVDGTSTTVTLDHKAERIVAVGPNVADLVSELAGDSVVATTAAPYQVTNTVKQRVAPDVNAIVALKPDIVIIEDGAESIELVSPLREKGVKVALLRAPATVKDVEDQTRNVGKLLGRESKADSFIATMMNYIRDTESLRFAHRDDPKQTVAVYNENGLRVKKTVNGVVTDYTLHGKNVVHMTRASDELHFFYDAQNRPAVGVYNGVPYAYVKSLQGDIVAILDENGNTVVSYGYDAWGAPLWCTGELAETLGMVQPFRYRGYVRLYQ